jgi:hypothetical protein
MTTTIELPRTVPGEEPVSNELPEIENTFDDFGSELVDADDTAPEVEIMGLGSRGSAVRAPIYANPESRPERTLPRAAREQIAADTRSTSGSDDPFQALMERFGK